MRQGLAADNDACANRPDKYVNRPLPPSTLREMQRVLSYPRLWLIFAIVVLLFAVTGPFGTFERLPFHARLGYWLSIHVVSWLAAIASAVAFRQLLAERVTSLVARVVIAAVVAAFPIALAVMVLTALFLGAGISLAEYGTNLINCIPVSIAINLIVAFGLESATLPGEEAEVALAGRPAPAPEPAAVRQVPERPRLLDRLPVDKRGRLVRIEVDDHYVRIVTDRGADMQLMRMADAIAEAGDGIRVHRSHWVAADALSAIERTAGKSPRLFALCSDGARLPVSRSQHATVLEWLDRRNRGA